MPARDLSDGQATSPGTSRAAGTETKKGQTMQKYIVKVTKKQTREVVVHANSPDEAKKLGLAKVNAQPAK